MLVGDEVVYTQKFLFFMERLKERERESWKGFRVLNLKQHQTERLEAAIAVASSAIVRGSGPKVGTWPSQYQFFSSK